MKYIKFDICTTKIYIKYMSALLELERLVETDAARLIHIVGVPRSMSTALGRSLNETDAPSVFVNEPFNRDNANPEVAARSLLAAYETAEGEARQPVIITKNMASYINDEAFAALDRLASATLWSIRNPYIQIGSLVTRIVNDMRVGAGEDAIPQSAIQPYLESACSFLIDSPKSRNFSKTGWEAIGRHAANRRSDAVCVAVDGEEFARNPTVCLQNVCEKIGLSQNERMVSGWMSGFVNVINIDDWQETRRSAWTSRVSQSLGISPSQREALNPAILPAALFEHIESVALPVYEQLSCA